MNARTLLLVIVTALFVAAWRNDRPPHTSPDTAAQAAESRRGIPSTASRQATGLAIPVRTSVVSRRSTDSVELPDCFPDCLPGTNRGLVDIGGTDEPAGWVFADCVPAHVPHGMAHSDDETYSPSFGCYDLASPTEIPASPSSRPIRPAARQPAAAWITADRHREPSGNRANIVIDKAAVTTVAGRARLRTRDGQDLPLPAGIGAGEYRVVGSNGEVAVLRIGLELSDQNAHEELAAQRPFHQVFAQGRRWYFIRVEPNSEAPSHTVTGMMTAATTPLDRSVAPIESQGPAADIDAQLVVRQIRRKLADMLARTKQYLWEAVGPSRSALRSIETDDSPALR